MHRGIRKLFTHLILLYTTLYLPKRRFLLEYSVKIPNKSSLFTAGQCFSKKINSLYAICHNKKLPVKMKKQSKRRSALHVFKTMVSISISYLIFFPPMYLSRKERTHEEAKEKKKVHSSGHPPLHCNNPVLPPLLPPLPPPVLPPPLLLPSPLTNQQVWVGYFTIPCQHIVG